MGEWCWLSSTRNLQSAGLFTVIFTFETAMHAPGRAAVTAFFDSLCDGVAPSTHLRACGLAIVEAGERSSDCALLRSALLLARSQLNLGVRPTFLTVARTL